MHDGAARHHCLRVRVSHFAERLSSWTPTNYSPNPRRTTWNTGPAGKASFNGSILRKRSARKPEKFTYPTLTTNIDINTEEHLKNKLTELRDSALELREYWIAMGSAPSLGKEVELEALRRLAELVEQWILELEGR